MSWKIAVKPKAIFVDETKPKVEILQILAADFEPEVGLTFRVSCCSAYSQKKFKTVNDVQKTFDSEGNLLSEVPFTRQEEDGVELIPNFELESKTVRIEGTNYTNWTGGDLPYLETIILTSVGYEKL